MNLAARLPIVLFALFFTSIPGFMFMQLWHAQDHALAMSAHLRPVAAVITSSALQELPQTMTDSHGLRHNTTTYAAKVQFNYDYKGTTYVSDLWSVTNSSTGDRAAVQADVDKFKPGQKITAWVDENRPGEAVVQRFMDFGIFGILQLISVFLLVGSGFLCVAFAPSGYQPGQNQVLELLFDIPSGLWFLFCVSQFTTFFSHSSPPYPGSVYLGIAGVLLVSALVIYMRLVAHGILRSLGGVRVQSQTWGAAQVRDNSWTTTGRGGRGQQTGASWQSSGAAQPRVQVQLSPQLQVIRTIGLLCIFAFPAVNVLMSVHRLDTRDPERTSVYSKEKALEDIPEENERVSKEPDNPWTHKDRGVNYFDAEMYDKAIPDLTFTLSKSMDDFTLLTRARCYLITKQYDKALLDFQQLKRIAKKYMVYYADRGIGISAYHLEKYQMAVNAFSEAMKVADVGESEMKELHNDRAFSYLKLGQTDKANADLKARGNDVSNYWLKDESAKKS